MMTENTARMLAEFGQSVKEQTKKVNALRGKEAEKLNTELSQYIVKQTQFLVKEGVSVTEVQNALRAATDMVPQTYAPDADIVDDGGGGYEDDDDDNVDGEDDNDEGGVRIFRRYPDGSRGEMIAPLGEITYVLPMEEKTITGFSVGKLSITDFEELLFRARNITPLEMTTVLELVLTAYGKNPAMEDVTSGGEIVAGPDGEAFMPEYLDVREKDGHQFSICEPVVFKFPEEVKGLYELLAPITEKMFLKKVNVNKLIKAGCFDEYDKRSVKKAAAYIKQKLWDEFAALRETYRKAVEEKKGIAMFVSYEHA